MFKRVIARLSQFRVRAQVVCLCLLLAHSPGPAQEPGPKAKVVFFTPGGFWRGASGQLKTELGGKANLRSTGSVFDGQTRLVSLTHTRYVALQVAPGTHTFSANLTADHPNEMETVTSDLKAGSVSYFAITTTSVNYFAYYKMTSHIQTAACADFRGENTQEHLQPVEAKHVAEPMRPDVVALPTGSCGE